MFAMIEPYESGLLTTTDGNRLYWEQSGSDGGKPALHLHGGPGSGSGDGYRRQYDPERYRIVSFDQRGCGRSRPLAIDPSATLSTNTTGRQIDDIERLREHLGIESWLVSGISWGTTLALAYAQAHPDRVSELILTAVTTTTPREVAWITEAMGRVFPREWDTFAAASGAAEGERIIDAYARLLADPGEEIRHAAAAAWCTWEDVHVSLDPNHRPSPRYQDPRFRLLFATLVTHYWRHGAFLGPTELQDGMERIAAIPGVLIHGRLDVSSPLETAWRLHRSWPASELHVIEQDGHGGTTMIDALAGALAAFAR